MVPISEASATVQRNGRAALWLLAIGSLLGGCASAGGESGSTAAPANYRRAVAAAMRELVDVSTIKSAQITRPHERFVGLLYGGTRPVVCVSAVHPNLLGLDAPNPYLFYFNNGRAEGYKQGYYGPGTQYQIGCRGEQFTPFPELRAK